MLGFPANVVVDDHLNKEFEDVPLDYIQYHVICAIDCELLMAEYKTIPLLGNGPLYKIGPISGLSSKGGGVCA